MNNELIKKFQGKVVSYREALYHSMRFALEKNPNVVILGQGVDDFKGIFGTTINLDKEFGAHRVFDTPLAEEGITGISIGMALNGLIPINTHIRSDFVLLAMNQIINLAAKYKYMFGGNFNIPFFIRLVVGRSWGQGAQHSQSLQSLFAHIPGLTVIMPYSSESILRDYPTAILERKSPIISIEHRLMYDLQFSVDGNEEFLPLETAKIRDGKDITIISTSIMTLEAVRAADHLKKVSDIECEIIDLNSISHPNWDLIFSSVKKTGKLLIADTSWKMYGVCAEITRIICERDPSVLKSPVVTLGMQPAPCPTAKSLEDLYYPNLRILTDSIAALVKGNKNHSIPLPDEKSMADVYKKFKGPF